VNDLDDKWLAMHVKRQIEEMEILKKAFSSFLEDDDIHAERQRLGDLVEQNRWPSALYILIQNTPTEDVMALGERIERADAYGDFDALIDEARAAGVPGLRG